jgi:NADPH-dependent glutamate synthase beta subunit-like oxidoreductase/CO/xanthine dehydrogenase FAD-binding subunit
MTLQPVKYIAAESLQSAEALLKENQGQAVVLAGGTDILGVLKDGVHPDSPQILIGLKPVTDLKYVKVEPDGLRIGAMTTLSEIAKHPVIWKTYSLLAQAAASVASPQIRNVATIAGNLCQEPRCWYYRNPENTFDCLRKGGRWCDALFAENRYHSIYGGMCVSAAPCTTGCPIHNDIPAYMAELRAGRVEEAVRILMRTNPLPAITGRACSCYCEAECNRNDYDEPVSIRNVERFLGDYALEHAQDFYQSPQKGNGKSAAIVGAGPAGLVAAYFLRKQGFEVTVYDQMKEAGGMLYYSIPAYRLPKSVVQAQVKALEGMGIHFVLGTAIGSSGVTLQALRDQYHCVFLATGLWNGNQLRVEKSELLDSGLEFLFSVQKGNPKPVGKRVLVIGGGSVAVDTAITAKRSGAREVSMACLESLEIMPALPEDIEMAHEEGITILPSWGPQRVVEEGGKLIGLELVRCTSVFNKEGRFAPTFNPDETKMVEVDQVLVAIGQSADLAYVGDSLQIERGRIAVKKGSTFTSVAGVFAGGDVTGGSATVVQAMAEGIKAAADMAEYLSTGEKSQTSDTVKHRNLAVNQAALAVSSRIETPRLPVSQRTLRGNDSNILPLGAINEEIQRCANCGCVAVNSSDVAAALIALDATVKTTQRTLAAGELFTAAESRTTVLAEDELIEEIRIPTPRPENRQSYLKFRIRNSIDFPIVSVAYRAEICDGKIHDARLVLGAVAPVPLRMLEVENLLEGQTPGEKLAEKAALMAVKNTQPLARNKAKVEIVKALVSRAIQNE